MYFKESEEVFRGAKKPFKLIVISDSSSCASYVVTSIQENKLLGSVINTHERMDNSFVNMSCY